MKNIVTMLLLIVVAIAIPFGLLQTQNTIQAQQAAEDFENTEFIQVERGLVRDYIETLGVVEASTVASLSFTVSGIVDELYVEQGDYIAEGSVIAVLDNDEEIISYQQALLALNRAEANRFDLETVDEDEVALAEAALNAAWAGFGSVSNNLTTEDRTAMQEDYQAALENAQALQQEASTAPGGFGSAAYNLLTAEAGEAAFNAELTRLQNEQAMAQNQASANATYGQVLQAQAELDRVLAGASPQQLQQVDLNVSLQQQQVDNLLQDYEDTFLVAPFEGYVSSLDMEIGASIGQLSPVIEMTDIDPLLLTVNIDETDLAEVAEGMTVEVRFDALPDVVVEGTLGRISDIGSIVDNIVTYEADILIDMYPEGVRVGMTADVRIITQEEDNVLRVPTGFLLEDVNTGRTTVSVVQPDGTQQEREVELGLRGVQQTQIVDGLQAGDIVALYIRPSEGVADSPFE